MAKLYIVPTPIGNLEDITLRALRILQEADIILAEDTRVSKKLLTHYNINKPVLAYHQHNEHQQLNNFLSIILQHNTLALVSDAGTPGISDPGFLLIRACLQNDIEVECLPGATAFVPALVNSGFSCDRFYFYGFLPHKKGRKTSIERLSVLEETIILYESPFRLLKTLEQLKEVMGAERKICVSRELTKIYEENFRGTLTDAIAHFSAKTVKGEIVIVIEGR
ncbi:MAG: 16S rRNA (cytidine(1402)-2'-O)-methyltransferase [Lentimicrobiaceae bacterium]|nr:16S rRNA (cytidine(1402)-2'-O)-methyltransferase [Lentimicrobiaceae bacterium]